jgi:phosphoenolpyruvate carboxykinase (GTP)
LAALFKEHLKTEYTQADYVQQFTIRIPENLAKLDRVEKIYREKVADASHILYDTFAEARNRLRAAAEKHGDCISPSDLANQP